NFELVDLYTVDACERQKKNTVFMHWLSFAGPRGERVRANATWDTGADAGAMNKQWYLQRAKRLGELGVPKRVMRMADGTRVPTFGQWIGEVDVEGVSILGVFDVFESGGGWDVLFGKPLMATIGAVIDTGKDVVGIGA
ncbi:hypothetical protein C8R45DRAFT_789350, partial [Mycena sanguinolenta]